MEDPLIIEELAWLFAFRVWRYEPLLESRADEEFCRLVASASLRRAVAGMALLRGWVRMDEMPPAAFGPHAGETFYTVGPTFHRDRRDRHERLHGIGSYPLEDWETMAKRLADPGRK